MEHQLPKADPHTVAKHRLLTGYLGAYFQIMNLTSHFATVAYLDTHCSYGEYQDEIPGSPLSVYRLLASLGTPLRKKFELRFIDKEQECVDHLEDLLSREPKVEGLNYEVHRSDFRHNIDQIIKAIDTQDRGTVPLFAFIDPYGIKIPFKIVRQLLQRPSAEVFIYLNIPGIVRNLYNLDGAPVVVDLFDTSEVLEITRGQGQNERLRDLYIEQLRKATGSNYVWFFAMHNKHDNLRYYLVFATKHRQGFYKMKESMWREDSTGEFKFSDKSHQYVPMFIDNPDLEILRSNLVSLIETQERTGAFLEEFVKFDTMFLPKHKRIVLMDLEESGQIEVVGTPPSGRLRRRGDYPAWCIVRWVGKS